MNPDYLDFEQVRDPQLSPDGEQVYARAAFEHPLKTEIVRVPVSGGTAVRMNAVFSRSGAPSWY